MASTSLIGFGTLFAKNVPHILEKIFLSLDYESYKACMEVSHVWNDLLTSESYRQRGRRVFGDVTWPDEYELCTASRYGNITEVQRLLQFTLADVNCFWGMNTPLTAAASSGHKEVVLLLLDRGADPNVATKAGLTPLKQAVRNGYRDVVKLLEDKGADSL